MPDKAALDLLFHKIKSQSRSERFASLFSLTLVTGAAQIIVQLAGLISGIIIIRLLPTQEYAYYTLANAMLGTMCLLSDGGISTGVMSEGGKVWDNRDKLGIVLFTGMRLRRKFSVFTLGIMLPMLAYLLINQNAGILTTTLIILSIVPAYYASLSDTLLEIVPKLHQDIKPLQRNQMFVNLARLFLSGILLLVFPWAFIAIVVAGITRIAGNIKLRSIAENFTSKAHYADSMVENEIVAVVKRSLPGVIYYCLSGQITIWILSIFGNASSLAASGALSRLGMALNVVTIMIGTLIIPRFARLKSNGKLLLNRFIQILACTVILCCIVQTLVAVLSKQLLFILGPEYFHLERELFIYFLGCNVTLLISTSYGLYASRGWIIKPAFSITYNIIFLIAGVLSFDVSTLTGVLWFTLFINISQLLLHFPFAVYKIKVIKQSLDN